MGTGVIASADADKHAPNRRESGAGQNVNWIVAEHAAIKSVQLS
jgi:hypothetical protein